MGVQPQSSFVAVGDRRLHVVTWGNPEAAPVVLLHGMRDHARSWDWVAAALSASRYVIAPDLRGHGDSDKADSSGYSLAGFVLDLVDVVEAFGLDRFALVGHSLGGAIGLRYAAAYPEKVRAFCGIECIELPIVRDQMESPKTYPVRLRTWTTQERARRQRAPRSYSTLAAAIERMREAHPTLDSATIEHLVQYALTRDAEGGWRWKYDNAARVRAPDDARGLDLDEALAAISCPALLCYGDASWIPLPPARRLTLIAKRLIVQFPDAGHWLHHEARTTFIPTLISLLNSTAESPAHA